MAIVDELIALLGYKIEGEEDLKKFQKSMDQLEKKVEDVGRRIGNFAKYASVAVAGAMTALGYSVIQTSAQFESYGATLETIEGSAEKAKASLNWIAEFAKTTPYDVAGVTEAFVKLRAYGLDPMDGSLTALGDASSAMGKPLMQAVEAMADAVTGENERLKEFGITTKVAGDNITYTWRQNGKELTKTLKKNGVEIAKFLRDNFEGRFAGAMVRQSKTWNGMISNLGDTWTAFQRQIGDAGFFEAVKGQLGKLMDYLGQLQSDGTIEKWAKRFSDAFVWITNAGANFASRMIGHIQTILTWIDNHPDMFKALKYAVLGLAAIQFPRTFALLVLEDVLTWLQGGDSIIGKLAEKLSELTGIDADKLGTIFAVIAGTAGFAVLASGIASVATAIGLLAGALRLLGGGAVASGLLNLGKVGAAGAAVPAAAGGAVGLLGKLGGLLRAGGLGFAAATTLGGNGELGSLPEDKVKAMLAEQKAARATSPTSSDGVPLTAAQAISNAMANTQKMGSGTAGAVTQNDNSNRSVTNNITSTVNQTVQQATDAPGAAAAATSSAVGKAAVPPATRVEQEPAF